MLIKGPTKYISPLMLIKKIIIFCLHNIFHSDLSLHYLLFEVPIIDAIFVIH